MILITQEYIRENTMFDANGGCWLWARGLHKGYGHLRIGTKTWIAHRASWAIFNGPIPSGMLVLHKCDVPACVNPQHLFIGSQKDNCSDAKAKGRNARGERCWRCKMTKDDVIAIRLSKTSYAELAARYGITKSAIGRIVRRENWAWVG